MTVELINSLMNSKNITKTHKKKITICCFEIKFIVKKYQ